MISKLEASPNSKNINIFVYLNGKHNFRLIQNIVECNPDYNFFIYSSYATTACYATVDDFIRSELYELSNVFFISPYAIKDLVYKIECFGMFISTDLESANAHSKSLKLANLFRKAHIPIVELQHGMFVLGIHYQCEPRKEQFYADSLNARSFADYLLLFYKSEYYSDKSCVIGYPPYLSSKLNTGASLPNYELILSNLHWGIYTLEDKFNFYKTIFEYIAKAPHKVFIWKMHHGEILDQWCLGVVNKLKIMYQVHNILFYHEENILNLMSIDQLIQKADSVISTVSTTIFDSEIYAKPIYIYDCSSCHEMITYMKDPSVFSDLDGLIKLSQNKRQTFNSGLLEPYDNESLREFIKKKYKLTDLSRAELLDAILQLKLE